MSAVLAVLRLIPWWAYAAVAIATALWVQHERIESVTEQRDDYAQQVEVSAARIESMQATAKIQRQLNADSQAAAQRFQDEKVQADQQSSALSADLAASRKRLQVHGQCVPAAGAAVSSADRSGANAATIRLDAAAERNYLSLTNGIAKQRAQVIGLQDRIRILEVSCKVGG